MKYDHNSISTVAGMSGAPIFNQDEDKDKEQNINIYGVHVSGWEGEFDIPNIGVRLSKENNVDC